VSHIVTIESELRDVEAIRAAQRRLGWETCADRQSVELFSGEVTGWAIRAPGWQYPIVATADGKLHYDNYGGRWGDQKHLNALKQAYAAEHHSQAEVAARRRVIPYAVVREARQRNGPTPSTTGRPYSRLTTHRTPSSGDTGNRKGACTEPSGPASRTGPENQNAPLGYRIEVDKYGKRLRPDMQVRSVMALIERWRDENKLLWEQIAKRLQEEYASLNLPPARPTKYPSPLNAKWDRDKVSRFYRAWKQIQEEEGPQKARGG